MSALFVKVLFPYEIEVKHSDLDLTEQQENPSLPKVLSSNYLLIQMVTVTYGHIKTLSPRLSYPHKTSSADSNNVKAGMMGGFAGNQTKPLAAPRVGNV